MNNEKVIRTMAILRKSMGMNQTQLAAKVNVNQVDISLQENSDVVVIRKDALDQIGEILGVPVEELLLPYDEYILQKQQREAVNE